MDDSTKYIDECFKVLLDLEIIDSKYQFSEQFLGKCKNYYGVICSEKRKASNDLLYNLNQKMKQIAECFDDERLKPLVAKGKSILKERIAKIVERFYKTV